MAQSISELIARFESARQSLAIVLEQGDPDAGNLVLIADRELSTVFSEILGLQIHSKDDRLRRIEFLLNEIILASDRDGLIQKLVDQTRLDMKQALSLSAPLPSAVSEAS